eukprot:2379245-Rhodomonas_salina.2
MEAAARKFVREELARYGWREINAKKSALAAQFEPEMRVVAFDFAALRPELPRRYAMSGTGITCGGGWLRACYIRLARYCHRVSCYAMRGTGYSA